MIISYFFMFGVTYHIECEMSGLRYLPFATIPPGLNTLSSTYVFPFRVNSKEVNSSNINNVI